VGVGVGVGGGWGVEGWGGIVDTAHTNPYRLCSPERFRIAMW